MNPEDKTQGSLWFAHCQLRGHQYIESSERYIASRAAKAGQKKKRVEPLIIASTASRYMHLNLYAMDENKKKKMKENL